MKQFLLVFLSVFNWFEYGAQTYQATYGIVIALDVSNDNGNVVNWGNIDTSIVENNTQIVFVGKMLQITDGKYALIRLQINKSNLPGDNDEGDLLVDYSNRIVYNMKKKTAMNLVINTIPSLNGEELQTTVTDASNVSLINFSKSIPKVIRCTVNSNSLLYGVKTITTNRQKLNFESMIELSKFDFKKQIKKAKKTCKKVDKSYNLLFSKVE